MEIPEEVVRIIEVAVKKGTYALATCSPEAKPNVVPIGYVRVCEGKLLLADFYFSKTRENILKNPQVAITCWDVETYDGYQLKGKASIDTTHYYNIVMEDFKDKPWKPRAAVVIDIEEIYTVKPGEYGKRIK